MIASYAQEGYVGEHRGICGCVMYLYMYYTTAHICCIQ